MGKQQHEQGQGKTGQQGDKPMRERERPMPQHEQEERERKQPGQGGGKPQQWENPGKDREQQGGQH